MARLCAIRKSQAENGADCHRKRPIDSIILRNVCVVEVLGVVPVADGHVQVAVDPVEMDQVQLLERLALALLRPRDEGLQLLGGRACRAAAPRFPRQPSGRACPSRGTP